MNAFLRLFCIALLALAGCGDDEPGSREDAGLPPRAGASDDARIRAASSEPGSWLSHGRTYDEQRWSPLDRVNAGNAANLQRRWTFDTGTERGLEATPLVVDGVMYATGTWSVVFALDARTGELLWRHDPEVPREVGQKACCDVVNRGVAVYRGRVYSGTLDGRLLALDAETGKVDWEVVTVDQGLAYTITGAPRIVEGKVIIGNGGAEFGVRGYVSAYDPDSGERVWRTYTVPGDPSQPFESAALERAAGTWKGGKWWEVGGGGTVWDSMAYDPELGLLYVGTGNGSPWSRHIRSPGGGDNLYLSSILALRPSDGKLIWHFQTTPGDNWDYTATQHIILAELDLDGRRRKVILQAPKNGFFYVIDRVTGEFLSAEPYVKVTWAERVDPETGRPVESPEGDYRQEVKLVYPSTLGGHNWHPMSFNPETGLVYIPANEMPVQHQFDAEFEYDPRGWNTGTQIEVNIELEDGWARDLVEGRLVAWDPVARKEAWHVPYESAWNGGTLTTGGNLVFQGTADGRFVAYRATDGEKLWQAPAGTGVIAAPITYEVDGEQFVTVMAGWGGAYALVFGEAAAMAGVQSVGRVLTFKLGGTAPLPPVTPPPGDPPPAPFQLEASAEEVHQGALKFHEWCAVCHGIKAIGGGAVPDLRFASRETHERFVDIVLGGIREPNGMVSFGDVLSAEEARQIQAYVLARVAEAQ